MFIFTRDTPFYQKDPLYLELWKIIECNRLAFESLACYISNQPDYAYLLKDYLNLRINNLKLEDITFFKEIITDEFVAEIKEDILRDHFLILKVISKLINLPTESVSHMLKLLTRNGREQLNRILQRILCELSSPIPIQLFFVAFETSGDGVDYPKLLDFLIDHYNETCVRL